MNIDLSKTQKYINWLNTKLYLDASASSASDRFVKRGQVYWFHIGMNIGSELSKESQRPCVILQNHIANVN